MHFDKKNLRNIFLVVSAGIILYWILHETEQFNKVVDLIGGILSPFITGSVLAFVINVPMRAIEGQLKFIDKASIKRLVAIVITLILVVLVLGMVFWLLIPQVIETVQSLIPKLQIFFLDLKDSATAFVSKYPKFMSWILSVVDFESINFGALIQNALSFAGNSVSTIVSSAFSTIGAIGSTIMEMFIAAVFALYCLFQKELLARQGRKLLYAFLPEKVSDKIISILRLSNSTFSNFLSGQCLEVCILGVMFAISMAIFRMPYIPLVSVLVAVTAFIPIVGAWIGCVFGAFFMLVNDPMQAVWFVIMFLVIQQIENNMIYPRVVGTSIGLSGMWVLIAVAVGGELMGVAGMLLMIPITSVLYTLLREYTQKHIEERNIDPSKLIDHPPELRSNFKENRKKNRAKRMLRRTIRRKKRESEEAAADKTSEPAENEAIDAQDPEATVDTSVICGAENTPETEET